ncbi:hypothetical protein ACFYPS_35650, partial [Micromonospora sp. NPDC005087]
MAVTCRVLKIARQPYYRWLARPVGNAELVAAYRANALVDAHRDDPEFGYRFLVDEARTAGQVMAERTAWKICSDNGWWSAFGKRKRRGKGGKVGPPVYDDLVKRDFTADGPNQLWLAPRRAGAADPPPPPPGPAETLHHRNRLRHHRPARAPSYARAPGRLGPQPLVDREQGPLVSRPGARCRDYSRSVSPGRSPNPACLSPGTGL